MTNFTHADSSYSEDIPSASHSCTCGCGSDCACHSEKASAHIADEVEKTMRTQGGCSCEDVATHLFEFLDSQMPHEQERILAEHTRTCPHCSQMTHAEKHVREIVKRSCCESAPSSLRMKITMQIASWREAGTETC